jgi:hypothetical protein
MANVSNQQALHDGLGLDRPTAGAPVEKGIDAYGFAPYLTPPPAECAAGIQVHLDRFRARLAKARLAPGPALAVRDLAALCRRERLPFAFIVMPEHSGFRRLHSAEFLAEFDALFAGLRREGDFDLIDARTWVGDDGFWDGHHLHVAGAEAFSERFAREAMPRLKRDLALMKEQGALARSRQD